MLLLAVLRGLCAAPRPLVRVHHSRYRDSRAPLQLGMFADSLDKNCTDDRLFIGPPRFESHMAAPHRAVHVAFIVQDARAHGYDLLATTFAA